MSCSMLEITKQMYPQQCLQQFTVSIWHDWLIVAISVVMSVTEIVSVQWANAVEYKLMNKSVQISLM